MNDNKLLDRFNIKIRELQRQIRQYDLEIKDYKLLDLNSITACDYKKRKEYFELNCKKVEFLDIECSAWKQARELILDEL